MKPLKVLFLPWWSRNPYQELLVKHLQRLNVEVKSFPHSSIILLSPEILRYSPNVIHFHTLYPFFHYANKFTLPLKFIVFFSQIVLLRLLGVRIVWTVHELQNHEKWQIRSEQLFGICLARFASAIFTHCEAAKQEVMQSLYLQRSDKICVIPHGNYIGYHENQIDRVEARRILGIPENGTLLLFLGIIRLYKGVPELIDAFKQLPQNNSYLAIAGKAVTPEIAAQIQQAIAGYDNIKFFPGYVADDRVQVYMNACDAVVLPYRDILTSGSVILAMSFGRACIAPCRGCVGEVLDRSGAFLYCPSDRHGLLKAMKCALQHKSQLSQMGKYNRQLVEQWNWQQIATMTLKTYQHCQSYRPL